MNSVKGHDGVQGPDRSAVCGLTLMERALFYVVSSQTMLPLPIGACLLGTASSYSGATKSSVRSPQIIAPAAVTTADAMSSNATSSSGTTAAATAVAGQPVGSTVGGHQTSDSVVGATKVTSPGEPFYSLNDGNRYNR